MSSLPTGTVTFLFTDIEGSTRLLEQLGDRYQGILTEYRRLLRTAIEESDGQEVDTQGDACFAAFPRARDALAAAVAAQKAITAHHGPNGLYYGCGWGFIQARPNSSFERREPANRSRPRGIVIVWRGNQREGREMIRVESGGGTMAQPNRGKLVAAFRYPMRVEVRRPKFVRSASLAYIDAARVARAACAEFEVGHFDAGCCRKAVLAVVRRGMVTALRVEACAECKPVRLTPDSGDVQRCAAAAGPSAGEAVSVYAGGPVHERGL